VLIFVGGRNFKLVEVWQHSVKHQHLVLLLGDLLIGIIGVVNDEELLDLVQDRLELLNAFESLLNGLELHLILNDGLPLDGMEVSSLDQLSKTLVELDGVQETNHRQDNDRANWHQDDDFQDALDKGVKGCDLDSLFEVKVKVDLRKCLGVGNWSNGTDGLVEEICGGVFFGNCL
jgi:hypothetical protein